MDSAFITPAEIAERLGLSEAAVYRYLKAGIIPSRRVDHRILIHRAEFERWYQHGSQEGEARKEVDLALLVEQLFSGEIELVIRARRIEKK